jgi:hypothetical protein
MPDTDLDRYFADQSAPVRSAVFDLTFEKGVRDTGLKMAEIMQVPGLYDRLIAQAKEADERNVWGHMRRKTATAGGSSNQSR